MHEVPEKRHREGSRNRGQEFTVTSSLLVRMLVEVEVCTHVCVCGGERDEDENQERSPGEVALKG